MEKSKRILAIVGIVILVLCYVTTLVAALIDAPWADSLFQASLFCSVAVPVVIYGYMVIIKLAKRNNDSE